ncbi:hypothetical protein EYF80_052802 [Liparis tanakae]|uniref:Uncharacterized protein n=1 Tax=Liparis tanakae TaxID=230148 RepID=A0A4Z2F9M9_9TELE|nr:hypothetical protein EYF80_052802 [Liparis tanakae]
MLRPANWKPQTSIPPFTVEFLPSGRFPTGPEDPQPTRGRGGGRRVDAARQKRRDHNLPRRDVSLRVKAQPEEFLYKSLTETGD